MTTASNWTVEEIFRHVRAVHWNGLPEPVKDLLFKLEEDHEKLKDLYPRIGQVKHHMDDIEPELPLCSDMLDLCENDPVEYNVMRDSHKAAYRKMRKSISEVFDVLEGEE